jgi:anti-anti-sigma factor
MIPDFDVRTVNKDGHTIVVVTGEIDMAVEGRFADTLRAAQNEAADVILDFSGVTFIDSGGINVLIRARNAVADPSRLRVVGVRPSIRRVFEITRVSDLLFGDPIRDPTDQ